MLNVGYLISDGNVCSRPIWEGVSNRLACAAPTYVCMGRVWDGLLTLVYTTSFCVPTLKAPLLGRNSGTALTSRAPPLQPPPPTDWLPPPPSTAHQSCQSLSARNIPSTTYAGSNYSLIYRTGSAQFCFLALLMPTISLARHATIASVFPRVSKWTSSAPLAILLSWGFTTNSLCSLLSTVYLVELL